MKKKKWLFLGDTHQDEIKLACEGVCLGYQAEKSN